MNAECIRAPYIRSSKNPRRSLATLPALRQPTAGKDGKREYLTYSWNQYKTAAQEIAAGLRSIGIRKGDVVALDSETRLEFYLADLGILAAGSVAAALYPSYPPKDLVRTIQNCGAKALFVEDPKTLDALRGAPDMPRILLTGEAEGALSLDQLRERGRLALAEDAEYMARLKAEVTPADYAILYLTSGATGDPEDGAGHARRGSREHGHGARRAGPSDPRMPPSRSCPRRTLRSASWWRCCRCARARR